MNDIAPVPAIVEVDLQSVARQLADAHDACCKATSQALQHALRCGDLLLMAKAECRHGEWLPWLDSNFSGSRRLAQRYMRLAKNRPAIEANANTTSHLTIDDAVKLLGAPKTASDDLLLAATTVVMPPAGDDLIGVWRQRADDLKVPECDGTKGYIIEGTHDTTCQLWPSHKYPGGWYVHFMLPCMESESGWEVKWTKKPIIREAVPFNMERLQFVPVGAWLDIEEPMIDVEEYDWQKEMAKSEM